MSDFCGLPGPHHQVNRIQIRLVYSRILRTYRSNLDPVKGNLGILGLVVPGLGGFSSKVIIWIPNSVVKVLDGEKK